MLSHLLPTISPQVRDAGEDEPFLLLSEDLKRELSAGHIYRRSLRELSLMVGRCRGSSRLFGSDGAKGRRVECYNFGKLRQGSQSRALSRARAGAAVSSMGGYYTHSPRQKSAPADGVGGEAVMSEESEGTQGLHTCVHAQQ